MTRQIALGLFAAALTAGCDGSVDRGECDAYIDCVAAVDGTALAAAEAGYGENGTCWEGDDTAACTTFCSDTLAGLGIVYPGEEACGGDGDAFHPLVPEKYWYMWNTDGCTTTEGEPGTRIYINVDEGEGEATATGRFTATETWYWFHGTGNWGDDCRDVWQITGQYATFDYGMLNCGECDEAFDITRVLVDRTCPYTYYTLMGWDPEKFDAPDEEIYDAVVLFDTLTPSGNPNMDNRMLIVQGSQDPAGAYSMNYTFAWGHIYPRNEEVYGYPADYDWLGEMCVGEGR